MFWAETGIRMHISKPRRIMVVDDERIVALDIQHTLTRLGL